MGGGDPPGPPRPRCRRGGASGGSGRVSASSTGGAPGRSGGGTPAVGGRVVGGPRTHAVQRHGPEGAARFQGGAKEYGRPGTDCSLPSVFCPQLRQNSRSWSAGTSGGPLLTSAAGTMRPSAAFGSGRPARGAPRADSAQSRSSATYRARTHTGADRQRRLDQRLHRPVRTHYRVRELEERIPAGMKGTRRTRSQSGTMLRTSRLRPQRRGNSYAAAVLLGFVTHAVSRFGERPPPASREVPRISKSNDR